MHDGAYGFFLHKDALVQRLKIGLNYFLGWETFVLGCLCQRFFKFCENSVHETFKIFSVNLQQHKWLAPTHDFFWENRVLVISDKKGPKICFFSFITN